MRHFFALLLLALVSLSVQAVPAYPVRRTVTLADGSTVTVTLRGDEHHSWLVADDGTVVELSDDGLTYVKTTRTEAEESRKLLRRRQAAFTGPRRIGTQATAALKSVGSPRIPVILVNFTDSTFAVAGGKDEDVAAYYDLYCNGTRDGKLYKNHGSYGSIRDYFVQQSDSLFLPEFTIIGPVTLDHPISYYGANDKDDPEKGDDGADIRYSQFLSDAMSKAASKYNIDWRLFDNSGRSTSSKVIMDMAFFIFAGSGEANGGAASTIWPKERPTQMTVNGITFLCSACCNENQNITVTKPDGIGIMIHELSHALGLPDFYDTNYQAFGMDIWSVMDYGEYTGGGYRPAGYNAYERDFMGWRSLVELTEPQEVTLRPISAGGVGCKVTNPAEPKEYYVLENRQGIGWDRSLSINAGHGLQVTHVRYYPELWSRNTVNIDANRQYMTIIPANDWLVGSTAAQNKVITTEQMKEAWHGHLYPYHYTDKEGHACVNDSLTAYSVPAATVYEGETGYMNQDIHGIRENDDEEKTVTFYFGEGYADYVGLREMRAEETIADGMSAIYDLLGRRVSKPTAGGIYIVRQGTRMRKVRF